MAARRRGQTAGRTWLGCGLSRRGPPSTSSTACRCTPSGSAVSPPCILRTNSPSSTPMQVCLKHSPHQCAGIYGPGRNALEAVQQQVCVGECYASLECRGAVRRTTCAVAGSQWWNERTQAHVFPVQSVSVSQARRGRQRFTARCHVHDICATMCASMRRPRPGAVYNVVDDDPAPR